MKLKKIASLMLAGVMAVSMLAGCSNNSNNNGQPLPPDDDNTVNYSTMLGGKVSDDVKKLDYIDFANDADAQTALESALGNLGYLNSTVATVTGSVVNLHKDAANSVNIDGTWVDNVADESSLVAVIDDFVDDMNIKNTWLNVDGIADYAFDAETDKTKSSTCGALYVVDGSVSMDKVLNTIASQVSNQLKNLPNVDGKNDAAFSVTYDYTVSVSVVNKTVSAIDWFNGSANFIAVTVTRVPTQA